HEVSLLAVVGAVAGIVEHQRFIRPDVQILVVVKDVLRRDFLAREHVDREVLALDQTLLLERMLEESLHVVAVESPRGPHVVERVEDEQNPDARGFFLRISGLNKEWTKGRE